MHLVFYKYKKKRRTFEALGTISNLILLTYFRDHEVNENEVFTTASSNS